METSKDEYCFISEDDLSNIYSSHWLNKHLDILQKGEYDILQLQTTEDMYSNDNMEPIKLSKNCSGATFYRISRKVAQTIVDKYLSENCFDLTKHPHPVADGLVWSHGDVYLLPMFSYLDVTDSETTTQENKTMTSKWINYFDNAKNKYMQMWENTKRDIFILDSKEIGCPLVLIYVFDELCGAFRDRGYNVKKINKIEHIHNDSIVFLGDTFRVQNPSKLLYKQAPNAIYIGWYWHDIDTSNLRYFIYTYENCLKPNGLGYNIKRFNILKSKVNNCPLYLRANDNPTKISGYNRKSDLIYCYMGCNYYPQMEPKSFKGLYHGTKDHKKYLNYEQRKNIYLSSVFALGIQSRENIVSEHVSQRIYEGMAYGCVVLTNSVPACEQCDNIPILVENRQDIETQINYYLNNRDKLKEKQEKGYNFVKKYGTNHYSIDQYSNIIRELYDMEI